MGASNRILRILGFAGSLVGILLWVIMIFFNPYSAEPIGAEMFFITFLVLFLSYIAGLLAVVFNKYKYMWVVFLWSLPYGLYLSGTPGIFKYYGLALSFYLIVAIYSLVKKKHKPNRD